MDSHQIWYADANGHPKVESVAVIIIFCINKIAAAAILDLGKNGYNVA